MAETPMHCALCGHVYRPGESAQAHNEARHAEVLARLHEAPTSLGVMADNARRYITLRRIILEEPLLAMELRRGEEFDHLVDLRAIAYAEDET